MTPLTNVLPERARAIAYAVLFVLALVFAAVQASGGNWFEAVGGIITALFGATAASNVSGPSTPAPEPSDGELS